MKKLVCIILCCFLLCSCKNNSNTFEEQENNNYIEACDRPSLLDGYDVEYDEAFEPNLVEYTLNKDFSNVINPQDIEYLSEDAKNKLANNLFVIEESNGLREFYGVYQYNNNASIKIPSFVTTDSVFHSFHLLYEYLQRVTEEDYILDKLKDMTRRYLEESKNQYELLKGTEWEGAAKRNIDYFSVALALCGDSDYVSDDIVEQELKLIDECNGISRSPIFSTDSNDYLQDYSQFIVRGYYTDTEKLRQYFKIMMWYGQMTFIQTDDELNKSALLLNLATKNENLEEFECVYELTSFFAGEPDDNTYYEYYPIIEYFFGDNVDISNISEKNDEYSGYLEYIKELPKPKINSMVVTDNSEDVLDSMCGFRLLGQRFSLDSYSFENLTYSKVVENSNGEKRNMPNVLDVPASFGSDTALNILEEYDDIDKWPNYKEQIQKVRDEYVSNTNGLYSSSISSAWLGALVKGLETYNDGWPQFMQSSNWNKKNLMTFLGGYTELKHDLVLYMKNHSGGIGAGDFEIQKDDRGYVEPMPVLYHRISSIIDATINGLKSYNAINQKDIENLQILKNACDIFENVSIKEINNELPTDEEFDYIRRYGNVLEEIWRINVEKKAGENAAVFYSIEEEYPNFLVTDIATDFSTNTCLEIGEERPMTIYVAVYFDGQIRIARGVTYSVADFVVPIENRLTDNQWKEIVYSNNRDLIPPIPDWYNDVYSKSSNYSGNMYLGFDEMLNNSSYNLLTIKTDAINVRDYPSVNYGKILKTYSNGNESNMKAYENQNYDFYATIKNEGYTWYYIGNGGWIADDGTWIDVVSYTNDDTSDWEINGLCRIEIVDDDMGVYSLTEREYNIGENVYKGEQYVVTEIQKDYHDGGDYYWYYIGKGWIRNKGGNRIDIIENIADVKEEY